MTHMIRRLGMELVLLACGGLTVSLVSCAQQNSSLPTAQAATEPVPQQVAPAPTVGAVQTSSAQPAGQELLQPKSSMAGYGVEEYRIVSQPDEIISVLRNGAVVICKRVPSPVAAVRGYAMTGGVYEGKWLGGGLSHLLEHLVAGGSSERRTEAENRALLEKIGNDSNAYTTYDHTAFFVNTTTAHFAEAADLVTGWMLGAKITQPEYRREYEVVQRELERGKGNPQQVFGLMTYSNRYLVSPSHVPVIGYQEVIQGLSRDDVYSYYKMAYVPNNMIFSVAANIDPEEMLKVMEQNLADAKPGRAFSHDIAAEPPVVSPRTAVATFPGLGQAEVSIGFPSVRQSSNDMYPLDLLAEVLGSGESSILVEEIRDRQQLCSGIGASDDTPSYVEGTFEVDMQTDPDKVPAAKAAVLAELEKIKANGIDEKQLEQAKTRMKIGRLRQLQTAEEVAGSLALDYMTTGDAHFSDLYVKRIGEVTAEQVQQAAQKYLDQNKLLTTVMLPREAAGSGDLPKAEDLLRAPTIKPSQAPGQGETASAVSRTVLDNGLVVLHRKIATTPLVEIRMYSLGGLTAEDAANNGAGNLAMSLLPRGTTSRSAQQVASFFDVTGGQLATRCGNNTWYWQLSCTADNFEKSMDVYADVVNHPSFDDKELGKMRARLLAAIKGQDASWDREAQHYFKEQFFGPKNSPYQFQVIGTAGNVSKFSSDDLRKFYEDKILTGPRVLAIFGDVEKDQALELAKKYFGEGKLPAPPAVSVSTTIDTGSPVDASAQPSINIEAVKVQKTEKDLAGVFIGFESSGYLGDPSTSTFEMASCLTGGINFPTGYIFKILRDNGWVYQAGSIDQRGRSAEFPGVFVGYAGCDAKNVNKVVDVILQSVARLQGSDADIQADWFDDCKHLIGTALALQGETPAEQAELAGTYELFGLGYDYQQKMIDGINGVELPQVRELARSRLNRCIVTVCTPEPEDVNIPTGIRTYDSFPYVDLAPRGVQHDVNSK